MQNQASILHLAKSDQSIIPQPGYVKPNQELFDGNISISILEMVFIFQIVALWIQVKEVSHKELESVAAGIKLQAKWNIRTWIIYHMFGNRLVVIKNYTGYIR